jgi:regulator of sigma E protease
LPALDGGRIIFVIIRGITGNMITDKMEGKVHTIGMMLLLLLFVLITWNDIVNLFN